MTDRFTDAQIIALIDAIAELEKELRTERAMRDYYRGQAEKLRSEHGGD